MSRPKILGLLAWMTLCVPAHAQTAGSSPEQRIPRVDRLRPGSIVGIVRSYEGAPLGNARIVLLRDSAQEPVGVKNTARATGRTGQPGEVVSRGNGWFAIRDIPAGVYTLRISLDGYEALTRENMAVKSGDALGLVFNLKALPTAAGVSMLPHPGIDAAPASPQAPTQRYRGLARRTDEEASAQRALTPLAEDDEVFIPAANRWKIPNPRFHRYPGPGESQFVKGRWYDPYNGNKFKGDFPILGNRTFLNLSLVSDTFGEGRTLPLPPIPVRRPDSLGLGQVAAMQNLTFSAELFGGDAAFRPPDWRLRVTPVGNLNYAVVQAPGLLNFKTPQSTRSDSRFSLQEAFAEVKLKDLSDDYDFISLRAGLQTFNSDFRGFIFSNSEPGVRLFGNLGSNKYQYNLAGFATLVKDVNSGFNTRVYRKQQVYIANLYRQDFLRRGYTIEFSFHYDKEDPSLASNVNGFQVRPVPIGPPVPHAVRAYYYGFAGDGHFGRLNLSHAFYQTLGHDTYNALAQRPVKINAQMGALELSLDRDWIRYRASMFYASGSGNPRGGTARGFDAILDNPNFAGGVFSFWNREDIEISNRGVALVTAGSLVPDLRAGKSSGQANFVNPGIFLYNAGADVDLTPKLRGFFNASYLRFAKTESLGLLLNQPHVPAEVGIDSSIGLRYRPALSDNIIVTLGVSVLMPMDGFRQIYSGRPLLGSFVSVLFRY